MLYDQLKANLTSGLNLEGMAGKLIGRFSKALRDADPNDPIAKDIDEIAELWAAEVNFGIAAVKAAARDKAREVCAGGVVAGLALAAKKIVAAGKKSIAKWRAKHALKVNCFPPTQLLLPRMARRQFSTCGRRIEFGRSISLPTSGNYAM